MFSKQHGERGCCFASGINEKYLSAGVAEGQKPRLEEVFALIDRLPAEDRIQLLRHMLGGFPEDIGHNRPSHSMTRQVHDMDESALGEVLRAIAGRLTISTLILILTVVLELVGGIDKDVQPVVAGEEGLALYVPVQVEVPHRGN